MHYYQFNIGDYIKSTNHLSINEDITYRRLIDLYYDTELPIPTDNPRVLRRLRLGSEFAGSLDIVLEEFFLLTEKGWENKRCNEEIASYQSYLAKQKANGIKGGRPKKPTANPPLTQRVTQNNPKQEPLTTNHKPSIGAKAKRFTPPEIELITEYFTGKGSSPEEAEKFFLFYESKNWMVGKNKMQKWKSSAALWISRNPIDQQKSIDLPWHESWAGIEAKAKELGIIQLDDEHPQIFKARVFTEAKR